MNDDEKGYQYDRSEMLMRQRNMAEEERDTWKARAMRAEQERHAARAERDALRNYVEEKLNITKLTRLRGEELDRYILALVNAEANCEALHTTNTNLRDLLIIAEGQRDQAKMRAEALLVVNGDLARDNETLEAECEALREANTSLYDLLMIAEGQRDGARSQAKEMKQRLDEWVRWGDRMASGHPDAPMASLDHEVRSVIAKRYGISVITAALAVQP